MTYRIGPGEDCDYPGLPVKAAGEMVPTDLGVEKQSLPRKDFSH